MMDEARFGLHTDLRRVWTRRGQRPVVTRQIKYTWDYLYGALAAMGGEAHFAHLPGVNLEWDQSYLCDLAASDESALHVLIRDQAGFHLRDGDPRLPARVRIIDLPPYTPELNPCEQLWDIIKEDLANRVYTSVAQLRTAMKTTLRRFWEDPESVRRLIGRPWVAGSTKTLRTKCKWHVDLEKWSKSQSENPLTRSPRQTHLYRRRNLTLLHPSNEIVASAAGEGEDGQGGGVFVGVANESPAVGDEDVLAIPELAVAVGHAVLGALRSCGSLRSRVSRCRQAGHGLWRRLSPVGAKTLPPAASIMSAKACWAWAICLIS